jgi:hypothetical protein
MGADYYRVPLAIDADAPTRAKYLMNPEEGFAKDLPKPATVIASKPDVYDAHGALAAYLKENGFRVVASTMAFTLWKQE